MKHQPIENLQKELIVIRHNRNNEAKRQIIRKTISPSSRFLDNYFNSGMHINVWRPNGQVITKKQYNYGEIGLSHFYSKNNVLQKLDVVEKAQKVSNKKKSFLEFEYMDEGDIVVTIEHCSNCEDHATHTQHLNEIYSKFAKVIQKCIIIRFPYVKVYIKPIETDIIIGKESSITNSKKTNIIDEMYKEVRIGALEVQLAFKKSSKVEVFTIHSKLSSGNWPSISSVLNKIIKFIPNLNLDIKVYDKEEGLEKETASDNNHNEEYIFTKYENIKINLYLLNHPQVQELSNFINEELECLINPKKRKEFLCQIRQMEKESYHKSTSNLISVGENQSRHESSIRPFTGRSIMSSRISSSNGIRSNINVSLLRPMSSGSNFIPSRLNGSIGNFNLNETIEDKDLINSIRGMLICSKFTDKNGKILIQNLPYDSYLLEIDDSKNFLNSAAVIKFNKVPIFNKSVPVTQKFYGLRRQTHAYVEFYIYFNGQQKDDEFNLHNISGSEVIIRRCTENIVENNFFEDENKLILNENKKIKGRHETITIPGKYILEVNKKGYDYVRKEIELFSGENKINVELSKEKKVKINISILNYQTKTPIENVNLKISYSKSDTPEEGLTDLSGNFLFETVKNDDYVTIYATKDGYFACQRTFIKDNPKSKVARVGGHGEKEIIKTTWTVGSDQIEKEVYVYLVKENFITGENMFLLVIYSNLFEENFENNFLVTKEMDGSYVDIKTGNNQKTHGIITYEICKQSKKKYI